mgnify:CR=1 FL=1
MEKISPYMVLDLAKIDEIEAEIKQLTTIRNNMPREAWPHIEEKIACRRAELKAVRDDALRRQQNAKVAMVKAILVCDYITDVAEDFADASKKMTYSDTAGDTFRQMVKACSDRHEICMSEWGEIVRCIDTKGRDVGEMYSDWYDELKTELDTVIDRFIEKKRNTKGWRKI